MDKPLKVMDNCIIYTVEFLLVNANNTYLHQ